MAPFLPNIPVGSNQTSGSWFGSGNAWADAWAAAQAEQQAIQDAIDASQFVTPVASAPTPTNTPAPSPVTTAPTTTTSRPKKKKWQDHPAYMVFLREHGIKGEHIDSTLAGVQSAVEAAIARSKSAYNIAEKEQVKESDISFEERGLFRSGKRITEAARVKDKLALAEQTEIDLERQKEADAVLEAQQGKELLAIELAEAEVAAKEWATKENA